MVMVMAVVMAVLVVVVAGVVMIFCVHALGPSALAGHSTARVAVIATAVVDIPKLDQIVLDQSVDGMTPANRSTQIRNSVAYGRPWMLGHEVLLSSRPGS